MKVREYRCPKLESEAAIEKIQKTPESKPPPPIPLPHQESPRCLLPMPHRKRSKTKMPLTIIDRSERLHQILVPPIEHLISLLPILILRYQKTQHTRTWRAIDLTLQRIYAYRAHELPLYMREQVLTALRETKAPRYRKTDGVGS